MARQENSGAKSHGVKPPSSTLLREMNRPVLILIEACSPHAGISHPTETGSRGAQQESVGNAAAAMVVSVERQVNLAFTSRTDPKVDKRTRIQGVAKGRKRD
jgi:hypothetical protein